MTEKGTLSPSFSMADGLKGDVSFVGIAPRINARPAEERISLNGLHGRHKSMANFNLQRKDMTNEQRSIYDFGIAQVRLITEYPTYLRQALDFSFIKMVGKGGFGHVWAANDLKTGKIVAIKELHRIDGKNDSPLNKFIKEVGTMIAIKSRYVLPIYGYTAEIPFSIIMPYMSGSSLNDLLQKGFRNPTQLTIYSMCIAQGLKDIHAAGIVYRDLKTSNILMDDEGLPVICDFGTSKVYTKGKRMTLEVGTFTFMAPEVYHDEFYDQRCDIYSFGMLLYELSELKVPFRKMTDKERKEIIINGGRPEFSNLTPKGMKELIIKCWDGDPDKRPSWDEILECFFSCTAYYNGANKKEIRSFVSKTQEAVRNYQPYIPPQTTTNQARLIEEIKEQIYKSETFTRQIGNSADEQLIVFEKPTIRHHSDMGNDDFQVGYAKEVEMPSLDTTEDEMNQKSPSDILRNPTSPDFKKYLKFLVDYLKPRQFFDFYQNTISYIRGHWECDQIPLIFNTYAALAKKNPEFIDLFKTVHIFRMVSKSTVKYVYPILAQVIHQKPQLLDDTELKIMINYLHQDPYEAIYLFGEASNHLQKIAKPLPLFDALMHKSRLFVNHPTGKIFLGIFFILLLRSKAYRKKRLQELRGILVCFVDSSHKEVALRVICHFYDQYFDIGFDKIMKNFDSARDAAISLLLRMQYYPITNEFCQTLVNAVPYSPRAMYVLLAFANEGVDQARYLVQNPQWMDVPVELAYIAAQLLMVVCLNAELRSEVVNIPQFHILVKRLFELESRTIFVALNAAFKKMKISQESLNIMTENGIIELFLEGIKNPKMATICIMTLQTFAGFGSSPNFSKLPLIAVKLLNEAENEMMAKKAVLQLLHSVSGFEDVRKEIKACQPLLDFLANDKTADLQKYKAHLLQFTK